MILKITLNRKTNLFKFILDVFCWVGAWDILLINPKTTLSNKY